jgi:quinone-modifying oxidoreductase subunit QmoC
MADALTIQPDLEFIREVTENSGGDLKKCMQCATCSAVCSLSTESRPFPRQQVLKAQWGMSEQLTGDPAIWLCHDCGDCTARCPRGARPSAVMDALRMAAIRRLAFPRFMGSMIGRRENGAIMFLFSALLLLSVAKLPAFHTAARPLIFADMFPVSRLEMFFYIVSAFVVLVLAISAARFIKELRSAGARGAILPSLLPALIEIFLHRRFAGCEAGKVRRWGHLGVLFGFIGLATASTVLGVEMHLGWMVTPMPLLYPLKMIANLCAVVFAVGVSILIWNRLADREKRVGSSFCDWYFLSLLGGIGLTGILSETLRLAQSPDWMYSIYYIHLSLVLTLFLSTPYSKFVHFLYRTIAMAATWQESKSTGRVQLAAGGPDAALPEGPGLPHAIGMRS